MDGLRSRSLAAQAPPNTQAPDLEEAIPATPFTPQPDGGPSSSTSAPAAASSSATTDTATAGRALASTLATSLPADQMEVLLNLIIQKGEN